MRKFTMILYFNNIIYNLLKRMIAKIVKIYIEIKKGIEYLIPVVLNILLSVTLL